MVNEIRFGDFLRQVSLEQHQISYNEMTPDIKKDVSGKDIPYIAPKLQVRGVDVYRILQPYINVRLQEQIKAVVPLALYLVLFQLLILKQNITDAGIITGGILSVIIGLMFFMEGLKVGLMPFGETLGTVLPAKARLPVVMVIAFLLGIGVTFAEPAIGALKTAGSTVDVNQAPYLYTLLNDWADVMVLVIGIGVGFAAVLGTIRFIYGWNLKPFVYLTLLPTLLLTGWLSMHPELSKIIGLAWDCGAVTTGPVTVPLVLSLGIGIAASAGKGNSSLSGFGIVMLASLFPIIGVQVLAIYVAHTVSPEMIISAASTAVEASHVLSWYETTPGLEIILGIRAIVPLVLFLLFVMVVILKEKIRHKGEIAYGITLCVVGMVIFNVGLSYGLAKLGGQSGGLVPAAFTQLSGVNGSPLFGSAIGLVVAILFAWVLGFGATLAEPALNALGLTVENLTNGAFRKSVLLYAVSFGVGTGIALGLLKIIFEIPIAWLLIPGYLIAVVLTWMSSEEFVNIAWDSAGVTTGPITVPLVLALGLGFGNAVGAVEGFGILSMASIGPIISVLVTGLIIQWKVNKRHAIEDEEAGIDEEFVTP
ncbi:MAG: hypothetical protein ACI9XC_002101 [Gammaproteobacteria bacterium]|jgi:hypothetical protein